MSKNLAGVRFAARVGNSISPKQLALQNCELVERNKSENDTIGTVYYVNFIP
jgi:hypothetical protein